MISEQKKQLRTHLAIALLLVAINIGGLSSLVTASAFAAKDQERGPQGERYAWASPRMEQTLWGLAQGDCDADGRLETGLIERERLIIGRLSKQGFEEHFSCSWKGGAQAARIDFADVDGDGRDDAIISAVFEGIPASLVLKVSPKERSCQTIVRNVRSSLRVISLPEKDHEGRLSEPRVLLGQGWSSQQFFSGRISRLKLEDHELREEAPLTLPAHVSLYDFSFLPAIEGNDVVLLLRGLNRLEVRVRKGQRWKRLWRSRQRYGGSANQLAASQRPLLDQVNEETASFATPPLIRSDGSSLQILALKFDLPLKNIVGRVPAVRGGEMQSFSHDQALIFVEAERTEWLPGAVMDARIGSVEGGDHPQLLILMQLDPSALGKSLQSMILSFDLKPPPMLSL